MGGKFSERVKTLGYINPNGMGVIAYDNLNNISVDISAAGVGRWLSRSLLRHIFSYAFDVEGVKRINAYVQPDNKKSISSGHTKIMRSTTCHAQNNTTVSSTLMYRMRP